MTITSNLPARPAPAAGQGPVRSVAAQQRPTAGPGPQQPARPVGVDKAGKVEDWLTLVILCGIILASLGVSFTHMHDWTMERLPGGTPDAVGWINAIISELLPLGATLSLRKRMRQGKKLMSYALGLMLGGVALSLAAQLSAVGPDASWSSKFLVCLPALAALALMKLVMSNLDGARKAAAEAETWTQQVDTARAETAAARTELAEIRRLLQTETARAETEIVARAEAETRAETHAEIAKAVQAEIAGHERAAADAVSGRETAEKAAAEQAELARLAEGRLAESREAADRAGAARVLAEQSATANIQQVTEAAEQTERGLRQELAAATGAAAHAEKQVTELREQLRLAQLQGEQLQGLMERATEARVHADQQNTALRQEHDATLGELQQAHNGALNQIEGLRRQLARATERAEIGTARRSEISGGRAETGRADRRKSVALVPLVAVPDLPEVEKVKAETVAVIVAARAQFPEANGLELAEEIGISDRTIRRVLNAVPAEIVAAVKARIEAGEFDAKESVA